MGLQSQLSDVPSESVLVLMAVLIGKSVRYLRTPVFTIMHALGLFSPRSDPDGNHFGSSRSLCDVVGSGLAEVILLCDHLNLNRVCSYHGDDVVDRLTSDCVVCLNRIGDGDQLRKLACRHVFHKDCLDGWLYQLNFNCPLCRAPLLSDESVDYARRRVAHDLLAWFPFQ